MLSCQSLQSAEVSLKHLDPGYFLGKVCFMVTNGTARGSNLFVFVFCLLWKTSRGSEMEQKWSEMENFPPFKYLLPSIIVGKNKASVRLSLVARNASVPTERLDAVRKLAASRHCPLLFAEDQVCLFDYISYKLGDCLNLQHHIRYKRVALCTVGWGKATGCCYYWLQWCL